MAKLDEIAELLTEEIHDFKKSVTHLARVHEKIKDIQLRPDTKEISSLLKEYGNNQRKTIEEQQKLMQRILRKVEKSILLPSWAIKLSWGLLVCVLLVLGYSAYHVSTIYKKEKAAYLKGQDNTMEHFRIFFDENLRAKELYQKWLDEKDKK